ncbi:DUF6311 domain-containing protein [Enterobacter hormaechei]
MTPKNLNYIGVILSIFIGFSSFLYISGPGLLNVHNIGFLMAGDPAQHWIGWNFFKDTPVFQWNLGKNINYGDGIGSSIVFTDSIPLLAFVFKVFSDFLPTPFQYTGIWLFLCSILQSLFGYLIVNKLTKNQFYAIICSCFFAIAPPFLYKATGHYALAGQWVILASLYLYLNERIKLLAWCVLITATTLIHAYLLAMIFPIFVCDLAKRFITKELGLKFIISRFALSLFLVFLAMYSFGYFMVADGASSTGFGFYKMNLNALFNPIVSTFSTIIHPLGSQRGDYEGFNFLGIGIIILLIALIPITAINRGSGIKVIHYPILLTMVAFTIFALSSHWALGERTIFNLELPSSIESKFNIFRSSGRFFWPVFYSLYIVIFYYLYKKTNKIISFSLLTITLLLQIHDTSPRFSEMHARYNMQKDWKNPLENKGWQELAAEHSKIVGVDVKNIESDWINFGNFSSTHKMSMNFGYMARFSQAAYNDQIESNVLKIIEGDISEDTIYVFKDENEFLKAKELTNNNGCYSYDSPYFIIIKKKQSSCSELSSKSANFSTREIDFTTSDYLKNVFGTVGSESTTGAWIFSKKIATFIGINKPAHQMNIYGEFNKSSIYESNEICIESMGFRECSVLKEGVASFDISKLAQGNNVIIISYPETKPLSSNTKIKDSRRFYFKIKKVVIL